MPPTVFEPHPEKKAIVFYVSRRTFQQQIHETDTAGRFKLFLPAGTYTIWCHHGDEKVEWKGIKAPSTDLTLQPQPFVWSDENVGKAFDDIWGRMDREYSYFFLKKDVDWKALKEKYRPRAVKARSAKELADVLREMLAHLKDLHVWIATIDGHVGTFACSYQPNWNREATLALLEDQTICGKFAIVGRTKGERFGYFLMIHQSEADDKSVAQAVAARKARTRPAGLSICARPTAATSGKLRRSPGCFAARRLSTPRASTGMGRATTTSRRNTRAGWSQG